MYKLASITKPSFPSLIRNARAGTSRFWHMVVHPKQTSLFSKYVAEQLDSKILNAPSRAFAWWLQASICLHEETMAETPWFAATGRWSHSGADKIFDLDFVFQQSWYTFAWQVLQILTRNSFNPRGLLDWEWSGSGVLQSCLLMDEADRWIEIYI